VLDFREYALQQVQNGTEMLDASMNPTMCAVFVSSDRRVTRTNGVVPIEVSFSHYDLDRERETPLTSI
jgi:hypothetical protein